MARTMTLLDWEGTIPAYPRLPEDMTEAVTQCMSHLQQDRPTENVSIEPWPGGLCHGAMWASVPHMTEFWRDEGGGWMIGTSPAIRPIRNSMYIRLCPAPPDAEVQFGFCRVKQDGLQEALDTLLKSERPLTIKKMCISSSSTTDFRMDKIVVSAVKLHRCGSSSGVRFRELLGRGHLHTFIQDMLRYCYSDAGSKNILHERDQPYAEMVGLIATDAYGDVLKPDRFTLARFSRLMGLTDQWHKDFIYPGVSNVVMPRVIFDAITANLEKGIPPIVPQYVTSHQHMFNGSWREPCAGIASSEGVLLPSRGRKLLGSIIGKFNCDLGGRTSYWSWQDNPPKGWIDTFVRCIENLGEQGMPLSSEARADLALHCSHSIPVMLTSIDSGPRFTRLIDFSMHRSHTITRNHVVSQIVLQECNETGQTMVGNKRVINETGTSDGDGSEELERCTDCGRGYPEGHMRACAYCEDPTCNECLEVCPACENRYCRDCITDHESCTTCPLCGMAYLATDGRTCVCCGTLSCTACVVFRPGGGVVCKGCEEERMSNGT